MKFPLNINARLIMIDNKPDATKVGVMVNQGNRRQSSGAKTDWQPGPVQDEFTQTRRKYRDHPGHTNLAVEFLRFNRYSIQLRRLYSETLKALDDISSTGVIPRGSRPGIMILGVLSAIIQIIWKGMIFIPRFP